jgi:hypothetical protein
MVDRRSPRRTLSTSLIALGRVSASNIVCRLTTNLPMMMGRDCDERGRQLRRPRGSVTLTDEEIDADWSQSVGSIAAVTLIHAKLLAASE